MPQVNRKPDVVTELQALPSGKTPGNWRISARSVNFSLPFYDQIVTDPTLATIPGMTLGETYIIEVSRLDSTGGELAKISSSLVVNQLPEDSVYEAPKSITLVFA